MARDGVTRAGPATRSYEGTRHFRSLYRRGFLVRAASTVLAAGAMWGLAPACRAFGSLRSRANSVAFLAQHEAACTNSDAWQVLHGVRINSAPTSSAPTCSEARLLKALALRSYRHPESLEWLSAGPVKPIEAGRAESADFAQAAAYVAALNVDLIVAQGESAARAMKEATTVTPIVVTEVTDVVQHGLVSSLARPGANITGVSTRTVDLAIKRVELLTDAFPSVRRPILVYGTSPSHASAIGPAVEAARYLGMTPVALQFASGCGLPLGAPHTGEGVTIGTWEYLVPTTSQEFTRPSEESPICTGAQWAAFSARINTEVKRGADALVVIAALDVSTVIDDIARILRLPGVVPTSDYPNAGTVCLREVADSAELVADYVVRILKGAQPGDLPIISPTSFELVVNLGAVDRLGLTIAPSVLARATSVIK
jgi:putative ABC transport system substrate-binding protein